MAVSETSDAAAHAIDDLYRRHAGEVYRYAFAVLGQRADAEDVTQITFLNAYRSLEQGVRPRKPSNWLLAIASNVIKQRLRAELSRPRHTPLGEGVAANAAGDDELPTVGELLAALAKIPPLQRQALVLREFEGRSYREIAEILDVSASALETLLFRARRSLTDELESQLTCVEAQHLVSRAADRRLGRKERRRLRAHVQECPGCARFARLQQRNRRVLRNLALIPIPVLEWPFRGVEAHTAAAVGVPTATVATAVAGGGAGSAAGLLGGGVAVKAAAVVTAASIAGGVGVAGGAHVEEMKVKNVAARVDRDQQPGRRVGQVAPRGIAVPGRGVAVGRTGATPGAAKRSAPVRQKNGKATKAAPPRAKAKPVGSPRGRAPEPKSKPGPSSDRGKPTAKPDKLQARGQALEPKPAKPPKAPRPTKPVKPPRLAKPAKPPSSAKAPKSQSPAQPTTPGRGGGRKADQAELSEPTSAGAP
jgi:RNA polymerase sigma-70 factor, ECF subfamily